MKKIMRSTFGRLFNKNWMLAAILICGVSVFTACTSNKDNAGTDEKSGADLVVIGKIFTSENNQVAEAFAVKDGKYVYVGDKKGAEQYIVNGKTEVIDYTGKGLVMPGCGNGHAHYSMAYALRVAGTTVGGNASPEKFLTEILPAAVKKAKEAGATSVFGFGWRLLDFQDNMPTRQQMDAICNDLPIYFADEEGHKGLANTNLLVKAGIMSEDGKVLKSEIRGGEIVMGADGTPTGYLKEQAGTFTRSHLDNESLFTIDMASGIIPEIEQRLLAEGYTMYVDGWGNYFFNTNFYKAAQQMDKAGDLHMVLGLSYEIESWTDVDAALKNAADVKKYASTRVKPYWIKLFMDGTVETGTGFVEPLYPDGHQGLANWEEEELTEMTRKANADGVTMHVHVMGNKGVTRIVNAFIKGGKDEMRNTLVHLRNVDDADYKRMAEHNINITSGVLWHHAPDGLVEMMREKGVTPVGMEDKSYPMKSYFDHGINVTTHSDYPALSGSPDDPFGIMEIAVTGVMAGENGAPYWTEELVTREQAINAMTINIAKQMFIEDERGSIKTGKYADFLLVDKDVLSCPVNEIHDAKPAATYFEGRKVFPM
ncbi:MAG: amidohydrolase family protein [Prevotella sp.]|nr:amidohydrolase family protein [Prevotella sp.]